MSLKSVACSWSCWRVPKQICFRGSHGLGLEIERSGDLPTLPGIIFIWIYSVWWYLPSKRIVKWKFQGTLCILVERCINNLRFDLQMPPQPLILQRFPKCLPNDFQMDTKCFQDGCQMASRSFQMSPPWLLLHDSSTIPSSWFIFNIPPPWFLLRAFFSRFLLHDYFSMNSPQDSSTMILPRWFHLQIPPTWFLLDDFSSRFLLHDSSPMILLKIPPPWFVFHKSVSMIHPWLLRKDCFHDPSS